MEGTNEQLNQAIQIVQIKYEEQNKMATTVVVTICVGSE